jgi:hypothetical protein
MAMKMGELKKHLKTDMKEERAEMARSKSDIKRDKTLLKHAKKK